MQILVQRFYRQTRILGRDGSIHRVSAARALNAEMRLYDRLFDKENILDFEEGGDFTNYVNRTYAEKPDSPETLVPHASVSGYVFGFA